MRAKHSKMGSNASRMRRSPGSCVWALLVMVAINSEPDANAHEPPTESPRIGFQNSIRQCIRSLKITLAVRSPASLHGTILMI